MEWWWGPTKGTRKDREGVGGGRGRTELGRHAECAWTIISRPQTGIYTQHQ